MILWIATAVSIMIALLCVVNFVVYKAIILAFGLIGPAGHVWIAGVLALLCLGFLASFFLSSKFNNLFSRTVAVVSSAWIGFLTYIFFAGSIYVVVVSLSGVFSLRISGTATSVLGYALFAVAASVGIYGIYRARNIQVIGIDIALPNLPRSWRGRRAVFVSDIHLGQIWSARRAGHIADVIAGLNPDIILNGGDLYDGTIVDAVAIIKPLESLKAPFGSFFVMGNHEEFRDNKKFKDAIEGAGIRILDNEKVVVDGLAIVGVDYAATEEREDFERIMQGFDVDRSQPSILIKHVPAHIDVAEKAGISLQLSGHTHQGQFFPFSLVPKMAFGRFAHGHQTSGPLQVFTSSGAGTWGPPLRVGTTAEIILITFIEAGLNS